MWFDSATFFFKDGKLNPEPKAPPCIHVNFVINDFIYEVMLMLCDFAAAKNRLHKFYELARTERPIDVARPVFAPLPLDDEASDHNDFTASMDETQVSGASSGLLAACDLRSAATQTEPPEDHRVLTVLTETCADVERDHPHEVLQPEAIEQKDTSSSLTTTQTQENSQTQLEALITFFEKYDTDGSGLISKDAVASILKALNPAFLDAQLDAITNKVGVNKDGTININEFINWLYR